MTTLSIYFSFRVEVGQPEEYGLDDTASIKSSYKFKITVEIMYFDG